jgi:hypothetical protein
MAVENTLAYYDTATIMAVKNFIVQAQVPSGVWIGAHNLRISSQLLYHCANICSLEPTEV